MKTLLVVAVLVCAAYAEWNELMENEGVYEGDMVLDPDEIEDHMKGKIGVYASIKGGRWPNPIKFKIEGSINEPRGVSAIKAAIAQYHRYTCLRFVEDPNAQGAHLSFYKGGGCSSPVGHRQGRMNRISLASGCWRTGTVMHEMGHSIGLYHEQSRPDRDQHVKILWDNIQQGKSFNFNKQRQDRIDSLGTGYDYKSMMHYWGTAFGSGKITIQTVDPKMQNVIGQRGGFSEIDKKQINLMYCNGDGGVTPTSAPTCKDLNRRCPGWKKHCNTNDYVKKMCLKSCGSC